jgi:elongation factor 1 alpha-like protein
MLDWSQDRFNYIEAQVRDFLNELNYKDNDIFFIPVSGLKGINLKTVDKSINQLLWYEGKSLIELIDSLENPSRDYESPVRFSISDAGPTTINSLQGIGIFGKLETGVIFDSEEYIILPAGIKIKIRSLTVDNVRSNCIKAGQNGEILLNVEKSVAEEIRSGNILCCIDYPVPIVNQVRAQIITLDIKYPLNIGQTLFVHCQSQKSQAKIKKIEKIFSKDGKSKRLNSVYL